ncbi:phage neck terminator protein [Xylella fastidiosa]|uniref:phage neck terminator protein n=1 Tax=Xylella fastidiosa TaxID=2371 RepID=UPI003CE4EC94
MGTTEASPLDMTGLRNLLRLLLSLPEGAVRPADQPAPTGSAPFVIVKRLDASPLGATCVAFDGRQQSITCAYLHRISVTAYGSRAYEQLLQARALLCSDVGMAGLRALRAGLVSVTAVQDLSAIVGAGYEARARIELQITHHHRVVTTLAAVDSADIHIHTRTGHIASVTMTAPETQ